MLLRARGQSPMAVKCSVCGYPDVKPGVDCKLKPGGARRCPFNPQVVRQP